MKKSLGLALVLALVFSSMALAASVDPVLYQTQDPTAPNYLKIGDAYSECSQIGNYEFAYKIDNWDQDNGMDGVYQHAGQTITISNSAGGYFDWAVSPYPLGAVIVKASTTALVYYYDGVSSDTYLVAPDGKDISHATFCWNPTSQCYEEETAWAEGARYVKKGNWAMYVDYYGVEKTVEIIADYTNYVHIGTVTFSAPVDGMVTITINLTGGAIFYYDLNDPLYDDNLKIQDYAKAPTKTPSPGLFLWKWQIPVGDTTAEVQVPLNNFYGIHLDVALPVPCQ